MVTFQSFGFLQFQRMKGASAGADPGYRNGKVTGICAKNKSELCPYRHNYRMPNFSVPQVHYAIGYCRLSAGELTRYRRNVGVGENATMDWTKASFIFLLNLRLFVAR